ncbi:MAG: arginine--tRNA ligase, partial [Thermoplasmatales archaeon]|nr:arginine--tRNA ligase [Thermoplasmatales archaeon]
MTYPLDKCKKKISSEIKKTIPKYRGEVKLEIPPEDMGDFAFPCFPLASIIKKSPKDIS